MDRKPQVRIKIDETAINNIDSLELVTKTYNGVDRQSEKVQNNKEYVLWSSENEGTVILTLKNKTKIKLDSVELSRSEKLIITELKGVYKAELRKKSQIRSFFELFIIGLIIVFSLKVTTVLLIIRPKLTKYFILRYSLFNLIFVFLSALLISIGAGLIFCLGLLGAFFIEFNVLYEQSETESIARPIIAVIAGNLLLITIGTVLFLVIIALL